MPHDVGDSSNTLAQSRSVALCTVLSVCTCVGTACNCPWGSHTYCKVFEAASIAKPDRRPRWEKMTKASKKMTPVHAERRSGRLVQLQLQCLYVYSSCFTRKYITDSSFQCCVSLTVCSFSSRSPFLPSLVRCRSSSTCGWEVQAQG